MHRQRPLSVVPKRVGIALIATVALQIALNRSLPSEIAKATALSPAPSARILRLASFGEPIAVAKVLMLYLQAFDNQPGVSIPFRELDYDRLILWLARILELDPVGQYPLLSASRLYTEVHDPAKQRKMISFVLQEYRKDPAKRWQWLAHSTIVAKHRLHDLSLAAELAAALRTAPTDANLPYWARQMEIFLREDMGEKETARVLLGALLDSGQVTDPRERRFLIDRLRQWDGH